MNQADLGEAKSWLLNLLLPQLSESGRSWLVEKYEALEKVYEPSKFHLAFGAAPRFVGKEPLVVEAAHKEAAEQVRTGLRPDTWSVDQAARILLLLTLPHDSADAHKVAVYDVFDTADMGEQVAIFSAFPLFPYPEQYVDLAAEGIRTNMTLVLEAIALHNPYPAEFLDQNAWNQLFLKCTFTDRPLYKIQGITLRENAELARIISDYAHERWAAGREVTPEIWRPVGPYFSHVHLKDMEKLFQHPMEVQRAAAALVCVEAGTGESIDLLNQQGDWKDRVFSGEITWEFIGKTWEIEKETIVST